MTEDIYDFDNTNNFLFSEGSIGATSEETSSLQGKNEVWGSSTSNNNTINGVSENAKSISPSSSGTPTKRPMTSVVGKGYDPNRRAKGRGVPGGTDILTLKKRSDNSPQDKAFEMERDVHRLYEESASEHVKKNHVVALERAKQALRKEIQLGRFQEDNDLRDSNIDLTFAVKFNLSQMFYHNGMLQESMEAFKTIVSDDVYDGLGGGRLRGNMGNIHFEKGEYPEAIKNYNMALDVLPPESHNRLKSHILRNIGIAYFKLKKFDIAANHFEQAHDLEKSSIQVVHNLIVCYYALGDKKGMKKSFVKMLRVNVYGLSPSSSKSGKRGGSAGNPPVGGRMAVDEQGNPINIDQEGMSQVSGKGGGGSGRTSAPPEDEEESFLLDDELSNYLKEKQEDYFSRILQCARLIADHIERDWERGYDFIIEKLKTFQCRYERKVFSSYSSLSDEMEMEKALKYLRTKQFAKAIKALKDFERRDDQLLAKAATNLSFIYILEKNITNASKYANIAIEHDRFNAKALVNKGICHFLKREYEKAKDEFARALNKEPDCVEAIYNIGLIDKHLGRYKESLRTFKRLFSFISDSLEVRWQICDLYRILEENDLAIDSFTQLLAKVKSDPKSLFSLGLLHNRENDEANMNNYFIESYKYYPVNLEVVKKLAFYYVSNDVYEMALRYFKRAAQIDPNSVTWKLQVGHCLRHTNQYNEAFLCYRKTHDQFPENMDCLKRIIALTEELGMDQEKEVYTEKKENLRKRLIKKDKLAKKYKKENGEKISGSNNESSLLMEGGGESTTSQQPQQRTIARQPQPHVPFGGGGGGGGEQRENISSGGSQGEDLEEPVVTRRRDRPRASVETNPVDESNDNEFLDMNGLDVLEDLYTK